MQNVALWHERDISHSSAERIVLPDAAMLTLYMTRRLTTLIKGLEVDAARMRRNIDDGLGLTYSQSVLLALVDAGLSRDDAYRLVQDAANRASTERRQLQDVVAESAAFAPILDRLDDIFSESRLVRHTDRTVDAAAHLA
jgi:adenylosuccinate lyase